MDSDFHKIKDFEGRIVNENRSVRIGNSVWIGCRCLILKGSTIPDNTIVAAGSTIMKQFSGSNQVIGGNPVRTLKRDVLWE